MSGCETALARLITAALVRDIDYVNFGESRALLSVQAHTLHFLAEFSALPQHMYKQRGGNLSKQTHRISTVSQEHNS